MLRADNTTKAIILSHEDTTIKPIMNSVPRLDLWAIIADDELCVRCHDLKQFRIDLEQNAEFQEACERLRSLA